MTQQMSAGLKFRQALEVEKPLQIIGTVNAYAAMMAKKSVIKPFMCLAPALLIILMVYLTWA